VIDDRSHPSGPRGNHFASSATPLSAAPALARRIALALAAFLTLAASLILAASASAEVYWANSGNGSGSTIGSSLNDGSGVDQSFITTVSGSDYFYPRDVAVNSEHIFWSAGGPSFTTPPAIGRASLDGSNVEPAFINDPGITYPNGIAVDSTYLYWVDSWADTIGRARLDGTEVDPDWVRLAFVGYVAYGGIAVDDQYLYWTFNGNDDGEGKIGRVELDGSNPDPDFITGLWRPRSVEPNSEHLFWCDNQPGRLGRSSLDGSGVDEEFGADTASLGYYCNGIALDPDHIYFSSWSSGATNLVRMNIDGTEPDTDFITGANFPFGVAVTNPSGTLSPSSHDFGQVEVGSAPSSLQTFTLSSTGDAPLTIDVDGIDLSGADTGDFQIVDGVDPGTCQAGTTSLANGESCTVVATFEPTTPGSKSATLEVTTNAETFSSALSGIGAEAPTPAPSFRTVEFIPSSKRVKGPRKGKKMVALRVRVTNSGDATGTATVTLRSSSRKVRVPGRVRVQVPAGSSKARSLKVTVLPRAPRRVTLTAKMPNRRSDKLVLRVKR
jgi:virginiamycin B lyase